MSDPLDDDTIRVRRTWSGEPPAPREEDYLIDEVTEVSRRRIAEGAVAPSLSEPVEGPRRSTYIDSIDQADEHTDGSTIVAHRESRRRAARRHEIAEGQPNDGERNEGDRGHVDAPRRRTGHDITRPAASLSGAPAIDRTGRAALTPDPAEATAYPVRDAQPVIAPRTQPPQAAPQEPVDTDATAALSRRAGRKALLIAAGAASAAFVAAAVALVAIVLSL